MICAWSFVYNHEVSTSGGIFVQEDPCWSFLCHVDMGDDGYGFPRCFHTKTIPIYAILPCLYDLGWIEDHCEDRLCLQPFVL